MQCLRKIAPVALVLACGCGGDDAKPEGRPFTLNFAPRVGDTAFACGQSYMLGSPATAVTPNDFRMFVYDVALVRANGSQVAVDLTVDGKWQVSDVALLDFEDATGTCMRGGTPETNTKVVGTVPAFTDYVGLHFRVGVPTDLNHLNDAKQPPPLNDPSMFWSWKDGHILLANEWTSPINLGWQFRVAESTYESTDGCTGSNAKGYTCANSWQPIVDLATFNDAADTVKLDLAPFYAHINFMQTDFTPLTQQPSSDPAANATLDYQPGCHSDQYDAECIPMFAVLGIDYLQRGKPDPTKQTFASKL